MIASGIYGSDVGRMPRPGDGPWSWLVSVEYAGRVLRWCSDGGQDVELDGVLYPAHGDADLSGLAITDDLPIGSVGSPSRSVSVVVYMPEGVSVAQLERRGVKLAGSPVEVALLPDGGTVSDRCVLLRGVVSEPTYGADDEPVAFTAREPEQQADAQYPPASATTTGALLYDPSGTTPTFIQDDLTSTEEAALESLGQTWPRVFGRPGIVNQQSQTAWVGAATPAIVVSQAYYPARQRTEWHTLLLSLDHAPVQSGMGVVLVRADDSSPRGRMEVFVEAKVGTDYRGNPFTYVDDVAIGDVPDYLLPAPLGPGDQNELLAYRDWYAAWVNLYYVAPTYEEVGIGGPPVNGVSDPSAGDLLLYMVERSSLAWDVGRCRACADALSGFKVAGSIEARTTPIDWLSDHVFGLLPCFLTSGPLGLYPVAIPFLGAGGDPVASLTVDAADVVLPPGSVQVETDASINEITVRWCRDAQAGGYYKSATRRGLAGEIVYAGGAWMGSVLLDGDKPPRSASYDLPYVWDDSTALLALDWLCWREMKQRRTVMLDVDASRYGHLAVGDLVDLTADALHLDAARCLVVSVRRSASPWWRVKVMPLDE